MADKRIYVERRDTGDYAVRRAGSERASDVKPTQKEAIARARELEPGVRPHVERVRHMDKGGPDKWRKGDSSNVAHRKEPSAAELWSEDDAAFFQPYSDRLKKAGL